MVLAGSKRDAAVMMLNQQTGEQTLALLFEGFDTRFLFAVEKLFLTSGKPFIPFFPLPAGNLYTVSQSPCVQRRFPESD